MNQGKGVTEKAELWVEKDGVVLVRGVRCGKCGNVLVPPQHFGCEACGADDTHLVDAPVPSTGKLHTFTTVHLHPKLKTPFKVAEVEIDAGQLVRGRLEHLDPKMGDSVEGSIQVIDDSLQFVFIPQPESGA